LKLCERLQRIADSSDAIHTQIERGERLQAVQRFDGGQVIVGEIEHLTPQSISGERSGKLYPYPIDLHKQPNQQTKHILAAL
jgi:hypothetical protein